MLPKVSELLRKLKKITRELQMIFMDQNKRWLSAIIFLLLQGCYMILLHRREKGEGENFVT